MNAGEADCHYGDHTYNGGMTCALCGFFNPGLGAWYRLEKAEREGRAHYGHFHLTVERKRLCNREPDPDWIETYGMSEVMAEAIYPEDIGAK